jgi:arylsulfatase A-like enzyme
MSGARVALCLAAVALALTAERKQQAPDVILISLDTLRRDAVGVYQPERPSLTPALDTLARKSIVFTRAFTPTPYTLSAHMSMFTGLRPWTHGVVSDDDRLTPTIPTLPERMRAAGYHTVGVYSSDFLDGGFGFGRGFDSYQKVTGLTTAEEITTRALLAAGQQRRGEPLFLFLHYYEAHSDAAEEGNRLPYYAPPALRRDLPISEDGHEFCDAIGRCATEFLVAADLEQCPVDPAVIALARRLYDLGVSFLDSELGRLFAGLAARGRLDDAVVIVTSDHGEEFREHHRFVHSQPYDDTVAVPLIVHLPRGVRAGERRDGLVELDDLMPTVLEAAGRADLVPPGLQGQNTLSGIGHGQLLCRDKEQPDRWSLRTARYKIINDLHNERVEFYDLLADPAEQRNALGDATGISAALDRELMVALAEIRPRDWRNPDSHILSEEQKERLRAIGYLY